MESSGDDLRERLADRRGELEVTREALRRHARGAGLTPYQLRLHRERSAALEREVDELESEVTRRLRSWLAGGPVAAEAWVAESMREEVS